MEKDLQISFFDCCAEVAQSSTITVKGTAGHPRYRYIESAARHLVRWITVRTLPVFRRFVRKVYAQLRSRSQSSGNALLRQSAILRI